MREGNIGCYANRISLWMLYFHNKSSENWMLAYSNWPLSLDMNVLNGIHELTQHRSRFSPVEELHQSKANWPVSVKEVFFGFEIKPCEELTWLTCLGICGRLNRPGSMWPYQGQPGQYGTWFKAILCPTKYRGNVTGGVCVNNNTEKVFGNLDKMTNFYDNNRIISVISQQFTILSIL